MKEVSLVFRGSIFAEDGTSEMDPKTSILYMRVQIADGATGGWDDAIREAEAGLDDLASFMAGRRDDQWIDADGLLDGPTWKRRVAEQMACALGLEPPA